MGPVTTGEGLGETLGAVLRAGELGIVGNCVIFTFSDSFLVGSGLCLDGIGTASNKPCNPKEISSIGRTQSCKGAGKFFTK